MIAGILYLKNAYNLGDGALLAAWLENPYWQYDRRSSSFRETPLNIPFDSSNMTNWQYFRKCNWRRRRA